MRLELVFSSVAAALVAMSCGGTARQGSSVDNGPPSGPSVASAASAEDADSIEPGSPFVWKVVNKEGEASYIFAESSYVVSQELPDELWQLVEASEHILIESNEREALEWALTQPDILPELLSEEDYQRVLIHLPQFPATVLNKFDTVNVVAALTWPRTPLGKTANSKIEEIAEAKGINPQYLVTDHGSYNAHFLEFGRDTSQLIAALDDPRGSKRNRTAFRRAYLRGDLADLLEHRRYSDDMVNALATANEPWLELMIEAIEEGNSFQAISEADLLFPNGLIERLRQRGYTLEWALPGVEPSKKVRTPNFLTLEECHESFIHIVNLFSPSGPLPFDDEEVRARVFTTEQARHAIGLCLGQTTDWHDCVMEGASQDDINRCDSKHPAPSLEDE